MADTVPNFAMPRVLRTFWLQLVLRLAAARFQGHEQCISSDIGACTGQRVSLERYSPSTDPVFANKWVEADFYYAEYNFVYLVDLDLDGRVDVLDIDSEGSIVFQKRAANGSLDEKTVLAEVGLNTCQGSCLRKNYGFHLVAQLQAADWDGDGDVDLFVFNAHGHGEALYLEQVSRESPSHNWTFVVRNGTDNPVRSVSSVGQVQVIDWDQDGDFDVIFAEGPWSQQAPDWSTWAAMIQPEFGFLENMDGELHLRTGSQNPLQGLFSPARVLAVLAVDWDMDGYTDLLFWELEKATRHDYAAGLAYYEQSGGGSLVRQGHLLTAQYGHWHVSMQATDWDMDGLLDVRVGMSLLRRKELDSITERPAEANPFGTLGLSNHGMTFVDWDGDGSIDVLDAGSGRLRFFPFRAGEPMSVSPEMFGQVLVDETTAIAAGDWDGDGAADLVVCHKNGTLRFYHRLDGHAAGSLVEVTGDSNPFQDVRVPANPYVRQGIHQIQCADWNGDGRLDLLYAIDHGVAWLKQLPNGSLAGPEEIVNRDSHSCYYMFGDFDGEAFSVADINGDGRLDLIGKQNGHYYMPTEVFACERHQDGSVLAKRTLLKLPSFRYPNVVHVTRWGLSSSLHFILDADMFSPGFCIKPRACSSRGACAPYGCKCAIGYEGAADCSRCGPNYFAGARYFGYPFDCSRCAGDERVCSGRGVCDDDQSRAAAVRSTGSNTTACLQMGSGSCTCSEVYFSGTDAQGRTTCAEGSCPAGMQIVLQPSLEAADLVLQRCQACPSGTASDRGQLCQECAPGRASGRQSKECLPCEAGRFVATAAAHTCSACPAGSFSDEGQQQCTACAPGRIAAPDSSRQGRAKHV